MPSHLQLCSLWTLGGCSAAWGRLTGSGLDAEGVQRQSVIQLTQRRTLKGAWLLVSLAFSFRNYAHLRRNAKSQITTQNGEQLELRLPRKPSVQLLRVRKALFPHQVLASLCLHNSRSSFPGYFLLLGHGVSCSPLIALCPGRAVQNG